MSIQFFFAKLLLQVVDSDTDETHFARFLPSV